MRVVITSSTVPASPTDSVPRFVLDQALAMAAVDHQLHVTILAPHGSASHGQDWPRAEDAEGRVVHHRFRYSFRRWEVMTDSGIMPAIAHHPLRLALVPCFVAAEFFALWSLVRRERPDVIYAHWFTPQALTAKVVARLTRTPFGFTTHASDVVVLRRFGLVGRWLVRRTVRRASFLTAVSTQTAEKLLGFFRGSELAAVEKRLRIIPMGVHLAEQVEGPGDPHHVAIIARLVEKKGLRGLLEAWPAVVQSVPEARLTIAGEGPLRKALSQQVSRLSIDVSMPGYVTGSAKERVLRQAGVVVQPSIVARDGDSEGLPVALLEALAAGRVVVASDASGAQDFLDHGVNGFLVPAGDTTKLADSLIEAMELSGAHRARMVANARELAHTVAWPRIARLHLEAIFPESNPPHARET